MFGFDGVPRAFRKKTLAITMMVCIGMLAACSSDNPSQHASAENDSDRYSTEVATDKTLSEQPINDATSSTDSPVEDAATLNHLKHNDDNTNGDAAPGHGDSDKITSDGSQDNDSSLGKSPDASKPSGDSTGNPSDASKPSGDSTGNPSDASKPSGDSTGNPSDANQPDPSEKKSSYLDGVEIPELQGIATENIPAPVKSVLGKPQDSHDSQRFGVELSTELVKDTYDRIVKAADFDVQQTGSQPKISVQQVPYETLAFRDFVGVEYGTGDIPAISHVLPPHEGLQRINPLYLPALPVGTLLEGTASWYGKEEHGTTTACMIPYDMYKPTLATREIPCGTSVLVINSAGKWVKAITTDWGPAEWTTRRFDLSPVVFQQLGNLSSGVIPVRVITISGPSKLRK